MKLNFFSHFFAVMLLCAGFDTYAQINQFKQEILSPNTASLKTYSDIPVSKFTGTPNIQIPLWELKGKAVNLPIGLSYHIGNIRPNQIAGWVGTGWNLSLGSIYREVRGEIDELNSDNYYQRGYFYMRVLGVSDWDKFAEVANFPLDQRIIRHRQIANSSDLEPDIFHFNINNIQGTFFLDHNGKWRVQCDQYISVELDPNNPFVDPLMKYSLPEYSNVSKQFNKFILKDSKGIRYEFGGVFATEYSMSISAGRMVSPLGSTLMDATSKSLIATSWQIINIQSPNNADQVKFEYERGPITSSLFKYGTYNQTYKSANCQSFSYSNWRLGGSISFPVYPKTIEVDNQKIVFSMSKSKQLNYNKSDYYNLQDNSIENHTDKLQNIVTSLSSYVPFYSNYPGTDFYDRIVWMKLDSINLYHQQIPKNTFTFNYSNDSTKRLFLETISLQKQGPSRGGNLFFFLQRS